MTREDYEDAYFEALLCLRERVDVGRPRFIAGQRLCLVDGTLLSDEEVLRRWWGEGLAAQIRPPA